MYFQQSIKIKATKVLGLVTLLSYATSSYAYSTSDDLHPLVECLNSVYDVFIYGLVFALSGVADPFQIAHAGKGSG